MKLRAMTFRTESRIAIAGSVPEVWAYVCDVGRWQEWARRGAMLAVGLVPLLALLNAFGQRPDTSTAATGAARLQVYAPARARSGLVYAALERSFSGGGPTGGWRPEEKLGFEDIVRCYTLGAAVAGGVDHRRGTLAPGRDADLVAWEVDPEAEQGSGDAFRRGRAVLTVVAGEVVMQV